MKTLKERAEDVLKGLRADIPENRELYLSEALALLRELVDAPEPELVAWQVCNGWASVAIYQRQIDAENYAKDQQQRHDLSGSLASFCVVPLYTAPPAPSVPADVARDAERYRWLRDTDETSPLWTRLCLITELPGGKWDAFIDAAIEREKGGA